MNKKRLLLLIPFAAAALVGCTPTGGGDKQCDSAVVSVDKSSATMKVGDTLQLNATIDKEGCAITWSSDNDAVASVANGVVTAHAVGTANIIANGKTVCVVTVTQDGPGPVNPQHAGTLEDPYDNADALLVGNSLPSGEATEQQYYIKGKVAAFEEDFSPDYGNYSFSIEGGFICWRLKNGPEFQKFEEGDIEIGDEVIVFAKIQNYHKDGQPDKPETKDGYVHSVKKDGPQEPSLKLDKTEASLKIGKTVTITATVKNTDEAIAWSIEGTAASMVVSGDNKSVTLTGESVGSATVKAKLNNAALEESCVVTVSEPAPVGQGAVYTFENDKTTAQNWKDIGEAGFLKATVGDGDEIITGYKDGNNAYIGGNGGSGDSSWDIWNCLKVGKSGAQGTITINLDNTLNFESIKMSVIGNRDDGTLTVNGITKNVTKKAVKGDLEPMELDFDISGGISELTLSSKQASSGNYGICITRIEFVGQQEVVLESITADMTNKEYEVGDPLSLEGLTVTGHYSDGSEAAITEGYETSLEAGHIMSLEDTSLRVSVGEIHTDIALTVTDPTLVLDHITIAGVKTQYYAGQTLGDVTVTAHYIGGTELDVTSSAVLKIGDTVVSSDHIMALGESKIVATYEDETDEVEFTVVEDTVTELIVATDTHREFNVGAEFVPETINALYASGKVDEDVNATFDGYDMDNAGEQTVTVEFGGASTTYDIIVSKVQREALPYTGEVAGGALPAKWELSGSGATFATSYFALKGNGAAITASKLIDEQSAIKVAVKGVCNGTSTDSLVTVYALNDADEVVDSDTYVPAKASSTNAAQVEANSTVCEVALAGEGITGVKVELTTKGHNYVLMSVVISEDVPPVPPVLESIEVSTSEHREFYLNDPFVPETILAKYDKGDDVDVTEDALFEDYDMETAGEQTVKVSYGGKETSYDITVLETPAPVIKSISIDADDMLTEYYDGDDIDLTGVKVYAHYESGDPVELDEDKYSLVCDPEQADIESKKTSLTATLLDTEAGVEPATLDVDLTVTAKPAPVEDVVETLTVESLGIGTSYGDFSTCVSSGILFQGNATTSSQKGIQIRDTGSGSGIYSRTGGRLIKSIQIEFDDANGKTISVYGQENGYTGIKATPDGTLLGTFTENQTLTVTESVKNICIISTGATYIKHIVVTYAGGAIVPVVSGVTLDKESADLGAGEDLTLNAIVEGLGCTQAVDWESSDESKATVSNGVVHGVSTGEVTITAKSHDDNSKYAECVVNVTSESTLMCADFTTKAASHSAYNDTWTYGDFSLTCAANNSASWDYIKLGAKSATSGTVKETVGIIGAENTTETAITKILVDIAAGSLSKNGMSVTEWGVKVYSDSTKATLIDQVISETAMAKTAFSESFAPSEGKTWGAGCYFEIYFNCSNTTTTNGVVCVSKVSFIG